MSYRCKYCGCHCLITLVGDANLLAPVTFSQSAHLLIGILRRWSCTVSLVYYGFNLFTRYLLKKYVLYKILSHI